MPQVLMFTRIKFAQEELRVRVSVVARGGGHGSKHHHSIHGSSSTLGKRLSSIARHAR
jgi:hypothetical protein